MTREAVAIDFVELSGGELRMERDRSRAGCTNNFSLARPVPGVPADVPQLAAGEQGMSALSSCLSEGFRKWPELVSSRTSGLCRPRHDGMAAARYRCGENHGMTSAEDSHDITEDHSVDHSGVTNAEVANSLIRQSLSQHAVEGHTAAVHSFARLHSNVGKPRTAQLTIFYAGMVNVYDDVPQDKAEAIMLLAGRARTRASLNDTSVLSGSYATERCLPACIAMNQPVPRAESPSQLASNPESVSNAKRPKTIATRVELPQGRRASLARFLEMRKDRLRAGPYTKSNCTAANPSWPSSQTLSAISSPSRSN